jgi:serine/threonine-protein kinase
LELRPDLIIADRFRLVRPLGEGGMGAVWLAHHIRLQIPCAVKFMHPAVAAEPAFRSRFDREAVAAAQLRSPHVVQVLDHGVWEEMPYIAMECLEGEGLDQRLAHRGKLTPEETLLIAGQVARALTKAHAAGLVHRDLKPPNIYVVRDDDREIVKVLDFGIAKASGPSTGVQTKTGAIVGTPYYMSPEQAQGTKIVDHRTDLWALGVVVYECLTGTLPFVSEAFGDLVLKIIVDPIPVPSQIAPVPAGFDAWWARAVDRDPGARFQSAKEMVEALSVALDLRAGGAAEGVGNDVAAVAPRPGSVSTPPETVPGAPVFARSGATAQSAPDAALSPAKITPVAAAPPSGRSRPLMLGLVALVALITPIAVVSLRSRDGGARAPEGLTSAAPSALPIAAPPVSAAPPQPDLSASALPVPVIVPSAPVPASAAPSASAARPTPVVSPRPTARPTATATAPGHDIGF